MDSDGLWIHGILNRQYLLQQIRHFGERDQGRPLRLQVHHLRAGSPMKPGSHWTKRLGAIALTRAAVPPRIRHIHWAKHRLHRRTSRIFARVPPAAIRTRSLLLQIFVGLLRDYEVLHVRQQRFALAQIHAQCFHRQFPPLHRQYIPALFVAIGVDRDYFHAKLHAQMPRSRTSSAKRSLASFKSKRSGSSGPVSADGDQRSALLR
jgi:hypothetical protein